MQAELIVNCDNIHGEGILWNPSDGCIWWTDINAMSMWWHRPSDGASGKHDLEGRLCAFAPRSNGGWIMAFADRIELWSEGLSPEKILHIFEANNPNTRLNDGHTDRFGNFVVGGMNEQTGAGDSSVIRIYPDHSVETLITGISCANSTCFSADGGTMFFADTPDRRILAYDYAGTSLGKARLFADMTDEPGMPDGSCVDDQGGVWNAEWEGGQVVRFAPDGTITHRVKLPVPKPTCCAFGGDDLATLFITTSKLMSSPEDLALAPQSGGLFAIRTGIRGVADTPFGG